jgi:ABC-type lipoprotein release transport system permease subunit
MYPLKNLKRRSARTVLTVIGVSLAITLAIIMFSISEGIRESTDEIIEKSEIDIVVTHKGGNILLAVSPFDDIREISSEIESGNSLIKGAFPYARDRVYITANKIDPKSERPKLTSVLAKGGTREISETFPTSDLIKGTQLPTPGDPFYPDGAQGAKDDSQNFTHEILLNSILSDFLDVDLGDRVYISNQLPVSLEDYDPWFENTTWFDVAGIVTQSFEDEGDLSCTVHMSELQYIVNKIENDTGDTILVKLHDPDDANQVKIWLESQYERSEEISAFTQEDIREDIELFTSTYRGFSDMVAGITLLVALLFISTVIMISVKERTPELSALRALGFSRSSIFKLVLAESMLVCIIGFVIGIILGTVGTAIVNSYAQSVATGLPEGFEIAKITLGLLIRATGALVIIGVLVGLIPAFWASRLNIVDALKSE